MFELIVFLLMFDLQFSVSPDDAMENIFVLSHMESESTPECTVNPMSGSRVNGEFLATSWANLPEYDVQNNMPLPSFISGNENTIGISPMMMVVRPDPPIPDPPTPPVPTTPEPPMLAILGVSATALLLFLLYNRRRWAY